MIIFLIIVVCIYFIYAIIPTFYYKFFYKEELLSRAEERNICLTFDDGIDKVYTEKLLDLLGEHGLKASFFIVAKTIEENPQICKRMIREGHIVGLHSLAHKDALVKGYFYTKKDFQESVKIFEKHDLDLKYFRPPWGHLNIFTMFFIKKYKLQLVLWNLMVGDWKDYDSADPIREELIKRIEKGSIICLHDGRGSRGAPKRTIEALEDVIPLLLERNFNFVTVENLYGN